MKIINKLILTAFLAIPAIVKAAPVFTEQEIEQVHTKGSGRVVVKTTSVLFATPSCLEEERDNLKAELCNLYEISKKNIDLKPHLQSLMKSSNSLNELVKDKKIRRNYIAKKLVQKHTS
jgi:hypothetical protein